jgi:hypothetical protein
MKRKKKVKAVKKTKKQAQPKQTQSVRSKAARAHIAEGTRLFPRRTPHKGAIRKGVRAAGTKDDLGTAGRSRRGRKTLPGGTQGERRGLNASAKTPRLSVAQTAEGLTVCIGWIRAPVEVVNLQGSSASKEAG